MKNWIERLIPERLRQRPAVEDDKLELLLRRVPDGDPCLVAVNEILQRRLEESVAMAGSLNSDDTLKLRACERMECFRLLLLEIEERRRQAKLAEQEELAKKV